MLDTELAASAREGVRTRPKGRPQMHIDWGKLLFIHWPVPVEILRPLIPDRLTIDTFDGVAYIGVVPFTMWGIHHGLLPPIPGLSSLHELNLRTYVHLNGVPGVWFISLDANSTFAIKAARTFFHLPYFKAQIDLAQNGRTITYASRRMEDPRADFEAVWTIGDSLPICAVGTLEYFLIERYCLYSLHKNNVFRARIFHDRWHLESAEIRSLRSTIIEAAGIPTPTGEPLIHYNEALNVDIWPLEEV